MRKVLLALGAIAALAGGARADTPEYAQETSDTSGGTKELRLKRYVFDSRGQEADFDSACAGGIAQRVEVRRTAGDVAVALLSLGWATPLHVKVSCGAPTR